MVHALLSLSVSGLRAANGYRDRSKKQACGSR
jgi:hypothetical protein